MTVTGGSSADRGESLQCQVTHDVDSVQLVVGPLPRGTTSNQVVVEVSATAMLEISLAGTSAKNLTYQLPRSLSDDELQVKFSKKRSTLTVSWAESKPVMAERSTDALYKESQPDARPTAASDAGGSSTTAAPAPSQQNSLSCLTFPTDPIDDVRSSAPQLGAEAMCSSAYSSVATTCNPPADNPLPADHHATSSDSTMQTSGAGLSGKPMDVSATDATTDVVVTSPLLEDESKASPIARPQQSAKSRKKKGKNKNKQAAQSQEVQHSSELVHGLEDLEATADSLAEQLLSRGFGFVDDFLSPEVVQRILGETGPLHEFFEPGEIWVGKEAQAGAQVARDDVRGDSILWMNFATMISNNCHTLHRAMRRMDTLIMNLLPRRVPRLAHVSEHSDAMLSIYPPPAGRFQKHIDNTARDGRCLTVLLYLNVGWKPEMGGALKLWPLKTGQVEGSLITTAAQTLSRGGGVEPVELLPIAGRLAMFYSDRVLHEVLPTHRQRYAVTQWYYDRNERAEALAAAAAAASATSAGKGRVSKARGGGAGGVDSQAEAHSFIRALMVDTSEPSPQLIESLIFQVEALSSDALRMASQIMGASTPQDLIKAVRGFTPQSLAELRDELSRMGQ